MSCNGHLHILHSTPFPGIWFANFFSHFVVRNVASHIFFFTLLIVRFEVKKCLNSMKSNVSIFVVVPVFAIIFKNHFTIWDQENFVLFFFLRVYSFSLRSNFRYFCVLCEVTMHSRLCLLVPAPLLKDYSFAIEWFWIPCEKSIKHMVLFMESQLYSIDCMSILVPIPVLITFVL